MGQSKAALKIQSKARQRNARAVVEQRRRAGKDMEDGKLLGGNDEDGDEDYDDEYGSEFGSAPPPTPAKDCMAEIEGQGSLDFEDAPPDSLTGSKSLGDDTYGEDFDFEEEEG